MKEEKSKKTTAYGKDNRGMSLVTVIIVIGFVAILVSILLTTSMINLKMKRVNAYAKDSFYSAEQVLDEINLGLQRYVSDALGSAYSEVLTDYADYDTARKNEMMQTKYYEYLWNQLGDGSHNAYKMSKLEDMLKDTTKWRYFTGSTEDGYGAILKTVDASGVTGNSGVMVTYENRGIVLKDLTVYYKDAKGFVSVIKTDICLKNPNFDFASSTVLPDVPKYSFIADDGIKMSAPGGGTLNITGDVYADSAEFMASAPEAKLKVNQKGMTQFIIKHQMNLKNAAFSNEKDGTVWADDIVVNSSDLSLLGNSSVADDLDLKGNSSSITLGGIYNGFGNSLTDSAKSSAILVNGTNAVLDLSGITKITLAGHAYVGTTEKNVGSVSGVTTGQGNQVFSGESLAVKSNQLMYLIPPECLWVSNDTGKSVIGENPISVSPDTYQELQNRTDLTEVSLNVTVADLGTTLSSYIKTQGGIAQPEKVYIPTSDANTTLIYYYMRFANEDAANEYFAKYYHANKESFDDYMRFYVKDIKFPNTTSLLRLRLAGNAIKGNNTDAYENQPALFQNASEKFMSNQETESKTFQALCTKLIKNYSELTNLSKKPSDTEEVVFDNLVDDTKMNDFIAEFGTGDTFSMTQELDGKDCMAVITKTGYYVNDSKIHLVIAKGDVTVAVPDFTGTIITDGKIILSDGVKAMTADEEMIRSMLRFTQTKDDTVYPIASVLKNGEDFIYSSLAGGDATDSISLADLITYENWTKE